MATKKDEKLECTSGVFFALAAVVEIVFYIQHGILFGEFWVSAAMWIDMAGKFIVGAAIFAEAPVLILAGSAASLLSLAMRTVSNGVWVYGVFWGIFWSVLTISIAVFLVNKKYAGSICFGAGGVEVVHFVWAVWQMGTIEWNLIRFYTLVSILLLAIGAILLGMELPKMSVKPKRKTIAEKHPRFGAESKLERLEKLNGLFEKGYITEEEFISKKEQIINPKS